MNKGWIVVTLAVIVGIGIGLFMSQNTGDIEFSDIETECRLQDNHESMVSLQSDKSLVFEGNYPIENINADLSHNFKLTEDHIRLEISNSDIERSEDFEHTCLASVVYSAQTKSVEPGSYLLEVYHDEERVRKEVIQIE